MDIAIIGAGNMGGALATSFTRAGHDVTITSRDGERAAVVAAETGARVASTNVAAVRSAEVVVIAVPFASSAEEVAREIGSAASGRIVIDVTNPVKPTYDGLVTDGGPSAAERFAEWLPGARVVKAFNTVFAANLVDPVAELTQIDGFVAADDPEARATVLGLVRSIGLRPIDAGPLRHARELEALAWLNISIQGAIGNTWRTAWKLLGVPVEAVGRPDPVDLAKAAA